MTRTTRLPLRLLALLLAFVLLGAACSNDNDSDTDVSAGDDTTDSTEGAALSGTLDGSGASFPDAFYQVVISAFAEDNDGLTVNYNAVGSGQGKKDFAANLNDFAGTDSLVKPEEAEEGTYLYVPTVAAPITVSYNLDGVDELKLSPDTLAGIFEGKITTWDDAAIAADNEGVELPGDKIVVVHRADGSGTTSNFTKYLAKAAPDTWTLGSGDTVAWPAGTQAGQKNTGVAQLIKDTKGAIGYVDFADAKATGLTFAAIGNKSGEFVVPSLEGASAAVEGATVNEDLSYDPLDAEGADAYPITAPTYLLLRPTYEAGMLANVKAFVTYVLNEGQDLAESADFAKLPDDMKDKALAQLDKVTAG